MTMTDSDDSGDNADEEFHRRPSEHLNGEEMEEWRENAIDAGGDWMEIEEGADAYGYLADLTPEAIRNMFFADTSDLIEKLRTVPGTKVHEELGPPEDERKD